MARYDYTENEFVRGVQRQLNAIRTAYHGNWDYLDPDGKFGSHTEAAVKAFQIYRGIVPASGELNAATAAAVGETYKTIPVLSAANSSRPVMSAAQETPSAGSAILNLSQNVLGTVRDLLEELEQQLRILKQARAGAADSRIAGEFCRSLSGSLQRFNPQLRQIKRSLEDMWQTKESLSQLEPQARMQPYRMKNLADSLAVRSVQRSYSEMQMKVKVKGLEMKKLLDTYDKALKDFRLPQKVTNWIKAEQVGRSVRIVRPLALLVSLKDVLWDLAWGWWHCDDEAAFLEKFRNDCYRFLNDWIIGVVVGLAASFVIALLGGGTAVIAIVSAVALVVTLLIGNLLDEKEVNLSKSLLEHPVYLETVSKVLG